MTGGMTKGERSELCTLIRKQERVMKTAASERSAMLMAEFEQQMDEKFSFNSDETWAQAVEAAKEQVALANRRIARRCKELGIPPEFAPGLSFSWHGQGENSVKWRRDELRRIAKRKIEEQEAKARTEIEKMSLAAQTEVIAHGMKSDAAKAFLEKMPALDTLMPRVDQAAISALLPATRMGNHGLLESDD